MSTNKNNSKTIEQLTIALKNKLNEGTILPTVIISIIADYTSILLITFDTQLIDILFCYHSHCKYNKYDYLGNSQSLFYIRGDVSRLYPNTIYQNVSDVCVFLDKLLVKPFLSEKCNFSIDVRKLIIFDDETDLTDCVIYSKIDELFIEVKKNEFTYNNLFDLLWRHRKIIGNTDQYVDFDVNFEFKYSYNEISKIPIVEIYIK